MSKTLARNNRALLALARDAYGNALSGNTERSLRFLRGLIQAVEANQAVIETKQDARATLAFDRLYVELTEQKDWPAFDGSKSDDNLAHWASRGITLEPLPQSN